MTFSELVKYRNIFANRILSIDFQQMIDNLCGKIKLSVTENHDQDNELANKAVEKAILDYQRMNRLSDDILKKLHEVINDFDQKIETESSVIDQQEKYTLSIIEPETGKTEQTKTMFLLDSKVHEEILSQISKHNNWHYPALRLGCRYSGQDYISPDDDPLNVNQIKSIDYSNALVANDPLYFCDTHLEFIDTVTKQFNSLYSKRIRKYVIKDHDFTQLPQGQFGFILCWMLFNYVSIKTLELYLRSIFDLLRPGGTLMFSYNNTELFGSAQITEHDKMHSILKRNLIKLVEQIGYITVSTTDMPNIDPTIQNISWIKVQKPGELTSIKLSQAIGTIKLK